jgi:hypothetical protein
MRSHASGLALKYAPLTSSLVVALVVAACGGGGGEQGPGPQVPGGPGAPSAMPSATAPGATPTAPAGSGAAATGTIAPPMGPMKNIATSAMAEDLKKLGIDPLKPQPLNKLSPDTIRKLMPTFAKSLGVKCEFCHDTNNFKTWTPKKRIASKMWSEFVVSMTMDDGSALYCDSCHQGRAELLDRADKKALSAWMDTNYVTKLKRSDKKEHSCEQCHGDPFEPKILDQWAKTK